MARGRPSKKQHILKTARELFSSLGYQGTSIDLVVRQAEVSKPTVYNNFPSKQSLLECLIQEAILALQSQLQEALQAHYDTLGAQLRAGFDTVTQSEFHLALYRIQYGERHKLTPQNIQDINEFDALLSGYVHTVLTPHCNAQVISYIESYCRQHCLLSKLTESSVLSIQQIDDCITQLT
ncbi:MAG: TetR/AcrR family transcriptional regulator [Pseudomonadales bacterium]